MKSPLENLSKEELLVYAKKMEVEKNQLEARSKYLEVKSNQFEEKSKKFEVKSKQFEVKSSQLENKVNPNYSWNFVMKSQNDNKYGKHRDFYSSELLPQF